MYASGFHEKSRVTCGVPRPRKGKTAWVCAEETDVVTVYVLSRILRACGSCSCDTPDRYMYYKYARVPMNGPRVEVVTCEASTSTSRFYSSINDSWLILTRFALRLPRVSIFWALQRFLDFSFSSFSREKFLGNFKINWCFWSLQVYNFFLKLWLFETSRFWNLDNHLPRFHQTIRRRLIPTIFPTIVYVIIIRPTIIKARQRNSLFQVNSLLIEM